MIDFGDDVNFVLLVCGAGLLAIVFAYYVYTVSTREKTQDSAPSQP